MKKCMYCGRENEDTAVNCGQCGTSDFKNVSEKLPSATNPSQPPNGTTPSGSESKPPAGRTDTSDTIKPSMNMTKEVFGILKSISENGLLSLLNSNRKTSVSDTNSPQAPTGITPASESEPSASRTSSSILMATPVQPQSNTKMFFLKVKEEEKGPYTFQQLKTMWSNGQITADALYRATDSSQWFPLSKLCSEPPDEDTEKLLRSVKKRLGFVEKIRAKPVVKKVTAVLLLIVGVVTLLSGVFCDKDALRNRLEKDLVETQPALQHPSPSLENDMAQKAAAVLVDMQNGVENSIKLRINFGIALILLSFVVWFMWTTILNLFPYVRGFSGAFGVLFCGGAILAFGGSVVEKWDNILGSIFGIILGCGIMLGVGVILIKISMWKTQRVIQKFQDMM